MMLRWIVILIFFASWLAMGGCSATPYPLEGLAALQKNDLNAQEASLRKTLQSNPEDVHAQSRLAMVRLIQGDLVEAEKLGNSATQARPYDGQLMALMGEIYVAQKRHFQAITAFRRAQQSNPNLLMTYVRLAQIFFLLGQDVDGFAVLKQCLQREPNFYPARFQMAVGLHQMGQFAKAENAIDEALRIRPNDEEGLALRARIAKDQGNFFQAQYLIEKGLEKTPKSHLLLYELLDIYHQRKDWKKAEPILNELLASKTRTTELNLLLAEILYESGKEKLSIELLDAVLKEQPQAPGAMVLSGRIKLQANDTQAALRIFTTVAGGHPNHLEAQLWRAISHYRLGEFQQGDAALELATKVAPGHPRVRLLDVRRWMNKGNFSKASVAIRKYTQEFPADGNGILIQAELALLSGQPAVADQHLTQIAPDFSPEALLWIKARTALAMGQFQTALSNTETLIKAKHPPWEVFYLRAVTLARMGKVSEALALISNPIKERMGEGHLHRLAGELQFFSGEANLAFQTLKDGLNRFSKNLSLVESASRIGMEIGAFRDVIAMLQLASEQPGPFRRQFLERLAAAYRATKRHAEAKNIQEKFLIDSGVFEPSSGMAGEFNPEVGFLFTAWDYGINPFDGKKR